MKYKQILPVQGLREVLTSRKKETIARKYLEDNAHFSV